MTMSHEATRFSTGDQESAPDAPRLHRGAIAAAILGVASLLAPLGMGYWVIPAAAIGTALYALLALSRQGESLRGRSLALTGLGLGMLLMGFAVTRQVYRESLMEDRSRELATEWFHLIFEDRVEEAHHLTLKRESRVNGEALASYYESEEHQRGLKMLTSQTDIAPLRGAGAKAHLEHRGSQLSQIGTNFEQYAHNFRIRLDGDKKVVDTKVIVEREYKSGRWYWRIVSSSGNYRVPE